MGRFTVQETESLECGLVVRAGTEFRDERLPSSSSVCQQLWRKMLQAYVRVRQKRPWEATRGRRLINPY